MADPLAGDWLDRDELFEVERFLYREARLLDAEAFRDWTGLLDDDLRYRLPVREVRYRGDDAAIGSASGTDIFDATRAELLERIAKLETGMVWFEDPPSSVRRVISNIDAAWEVRDQRIRAWSNFLIYRNRRQRDESWLVGAREDVLRLTAEGLRLVERTISLDQRVVLDKNLHIFF